MKKILLAFILSIITNSMILAQSNITISLPLEFENNSFAAFNQTTFRADLYNSTNTSCTAKIPIGVSADIAPQVNLHIGITPDVGKSIVNTWGYTLKLKGIDNKDYWVKIQYRYNKGEYSFKISGFTPNMGSFDNYNKIEKISKPLGLNLIFKDLEMWIDNDSAHQFNKYSVGNIKELTAIEITSRYYIHFEVNNLTVSVPEVYAQNLSRIRNSKRQGKYVASGSGFVLTTNGIIATNYHVVEDMENVHVFVNRNGTVKKYNAKVLISDKTNDLSLLKIDDASFTPFPTIPYAIRTNIQDVGTGVFALGYPMSNILGEEIKATDGIISSKTGFQGDIVAYQISAPIQPGNSGGPLFDKQGNLIGITNAGIPDAQNVGYAIKTSYLKNLTDAAPVSISLPSNNAISGLSFPEKIKRLTPYVVLIKVN